GAWSRGERLGRQSAAGRRGETEAHTVRGQGDGERSETDLEREPEAARNEHGNVPASYCTRPSLARGGRAERVRPGLLEDDLHAAVLRSTLRGRVARHRIGGAVSGGRDPTRADTAVDEDLLHRLRPALGQSLVAGVVP